MENEKQEMDNNRFSTAIFRDYLNKVNSKCLPIMVEVLAFWRSWDFSRNVVLTCDYIMGVFWLVVVDLTVIAGIGWFAWMFTICSHLPIAISGLITWLAVVC